MFIARGDVEAAVNGLMARGGRYGESTWASLQAAEKVLKAAINRAGAKYGFTHGLAGLYQTLTGTGLNFNVDAQVTAVQCKPGIRYGEEPCTCGDALAAHRASLELVNVLRDAAAKFELGIGGLQRLGRGSARRAGADRSVQANRELWRTISRGIPSSRESDQCERLK